MYENTPRYCMEFDTVEEIVLDNTMFSLDNPKIMNKVKNVTIAHPFHIHVNHFQVMGINHRSDVSEERDEAEYAALQKFLDLGNWRDTFAMPPMRESVVRYPDSFHIGGGVIFHCHISTHSGQGMMSMVTIADNCDNFECEGKDCWNEWKQKDRNKNV